VAHSLKRPEWLASLFFLTLVDEELLKRDFQCSHNIIL
jgi:hypothetical protein